jgi:hypothetical protein
MNIELNLTINGAKVQPTSEQQEQLKEFVMTNILGSEPAVKKGRPLGSKKKRSYAKTPWTQIEEDFLMDERKRNTPYGEIVKKLAEKFGVHREQSALFSRIANIKANKKRIVHDENDAIVYVGNVESAADSTEEENS